MITIPLHNRIDYLIDQCTYRRSDKLAHGPKKFVWWLPVVVRIVRAGAGDIKGWNIWIYTRWDMNFCHGVYLTGGAR